MTARDVPLVRAEPRCLSFSAYEWGALLAQVLFDNWETLQRSRGTMWRRITTEPEQMGGVPCIRGLRVPVATVVSLLADGLTRAEILALYPDLQDDDLREALLFAAETVTQAALSRADRGVK